MWNDIAGMMRIRIQCGPAKDLQANGFSMEETVSEVLFSKPTSTLSSGFVGTIICWCFGILLAAFGVLIALNGDMLARLAGFAILFAGASICGLARAARAEWKLRLAAILLGCTMLLFIAELTLRNTMNYPGPVAPRFAPHSQLGFVLDPDSNEIDSNGFRNPAIPDQVDVVAIGDIQTAAMSLAVEETWPAVFAKSTSQSVYNLAVPGYGPPQYQQLVQQALKLKPRQVIIGLNIGTDLVDAAKGIPSPDSIECSPENFRHKLTRLSALGSLTHSAIHKALQKPETRLHISHSKNPVSISNSQILARVAAANLEDPKIQKAFQATVSMLESASLQCREGGAALTVLLIPTAESVCGQSVSADTLPPALTPLLTSEANVRDSFWEALNAKRVFTIDAFPAIMKAISLENGVYHADAAHLPTVGSCKALAGALSQSSSTFTN